MGLGLRREVSFSVPGGSTLMAEIGFYHLLSTPLERALPRLLEQARKRDYRIVLRAASSERVEHINALLWTFDDASFLPHGSARDGNAANQPIWLTDRPENPNGANMLMLVDGVAADDIGEFERCVDMFDGNDENAVIAARQRWRNATAAGHTLTYWQQTGSGWERKV
jgi:DNA polymerase-3 subunit chi